MEADGADMWEQFESGCIKNEVKLQRGPRGFGLELVGNCVVNLDPNSVAAKTGQLKVSARLPHRPLHRPDLVHARYHRPLCAALELHHQLVHRAVASEEG